MSSNIAKNMENIENMKVQFLAHSGFYIELPAVTLLFDWWEGELPALRPGVPLIVFASHTHEDHFQPRIFDLDGEFVAFILGKDFRLTERNRNRWNLSDKTATHCVILKDGQTLKLWPNLADITIEAFSSTDEGCAFLITVDGQAIFHAGDLNWWHWEGEDRAWNQNMAVNFQRYTEPLKGREIDLGMLPLDPRQGHAGFWGLKYFLEIANIRHFLPMHQWEAFDFTQKFLKAYPAFKAQTVPIHRNGEVFTF